MAAPSITSISQLQSMQHARQGKHRSELSCAKVPGFHLQKMATCSTWRLRYRNSRQQQKIIKLGNFENGNQDRLNAAAKALQYRQQISAGNEPIVEAINKFDYRPVNGKGKNSTIGTYLNGCYRKHQQFKTHGGKHTIDMISHHFKQWTHLPMASINDSSLKSWQIHKQESGLSHGTIKRAFGALRTMLRHGVKEGVLEFDPSHKFQLRAPTAKGKNTCQPGKELHHRRTLTQAELRGIQSGIDKYKTLLIKQRTNTLLHGNKALRALNKVPHPHWFFPFFSLAAYTGLRSGDLYSLTWQELDLSLKELITTPNATKHHVKPPTLILPLDNTISKVMSDWHAQTAPPSGGLVFPSPITQKALDKKAHLRHWKKVLSLGEFSTSLEFSSLRHHYISRLVAGGIPLTMVARLAGQKSTKMIEQQYGHLAPHNDAKALALLSADFVESESLN